MRKKTMTTLIALLLLLLLTAAWIFRPLLFTKKGYTKEEQRSMTIVAHRGGAGLGAENSLSCYRKGMETGADMIETDIHLTSDSQIVACHDATIDRTTTGHGRIADMTLAELRTHQLKESPGETIPTLDELLELIDGRCQLLIEIKRTGSEYQGIEQLLHDAISRHHAQTWVTVQSFSDSALETYHRIDPRQRLEKLIVCQLPGKRHIFDRTLTSFSYEKYSYIASFNFFHGALTQSMIDEIHSHGKEVKLWTVDGPADTPHLSVDAIITNRPDLWRN